MRADLTVGMAVVVEHLILVAERALASLGDEILDAIVAVHEGIPLYVELPASVTLKVTYTEPGIQGDRSSGGTKPATLETGIQIQVPLFIKQDEVVLVDTRDGSYLGRA